MLPFIYCVVSLFLFTSTNGNKLFPPGISTTSDDCSSKESMISIGICSRYVHQSAVYLSETYSGSFQSSLANVTKLCDSIENCFEKSNCRDVRKTGKMYKEKCDENEMVLYKMKDCLRSFYYEVYSGATNCTKLYNYTSSDMNTRKNAFTSGKECFLSFTNLWCSPESNKYLKQSYDKLVNYLTIDNDGPDQCNSLYDELNSYQCIGYQYAVSFLERELEKAKLMKKPYEKNETEPMLEETRKCYRKYCKYTYEQYEYLNKLSEDIVNYNSDYPLAPKTLSEFDRCIEYILQNIDADKYKCIRKTPQKSGTVDENAPTVKLTGFLRDKECMKLVMTQECWMSLTIFEEGWEATRHQMKTLWKELIDE
ncbi:hypothetical protein L3Y34_006577 [Caenorhabditis briggsae]|uniref:T20D4.11-like domain-containing protein n=2 Tax=Caenorhabditis briggsae TaxID=6238 RepID=A0AAE9CY20_CAEBR|nr:hypothetical protein L3Y34_006577 [Caenorhabditis briggsae]